MRKVIVLFVVSVFGLVLTVSAQSSQSPPEAQEQTAWVAQSLKEMQTVKAGMTRADLLKVFTTEGGLSTGLNRTFVYRKCRLIKVDVEFEPIGRPARDDKGRVTLIEANEDVIRKVSKPYLEWGVLD